MSEVVALRIILREYIAALGWHALSESHPAGRAASRAIAGCSVTEEARAVIASRKAFGLDHSLYSKQDPEYYDPENGCPVAEERYRLSVSADRPRPETDED